MKLLPLYFRIALRYSKHYLKASRKDKPGHPLVRRFIDEVLKDTRHYYAFSDIEGLRHAQLQNKNHITIADYGAGSLVNSSPSRTIRDIVKYSAISPASGQFLFRFCRFLKPQTILELGTSMGISGAYLAGAAPHARMISIEGCPETGQLARYHFSLLSIKQPEVYTGTFEAQLPRALKQLKKLDLLYLDGDHRAGQSLKYFQQCLPYAHAQSVFVIADIHWSDEMEGFWEDIRQQPQVKLSIDLFHFGILFFNGQQEKQEHYTLIPF
jgi:predicted O-methyltransferase YrrM